MAAAKKEYVAPTVTVLGRLENFPVPPPRTQSDAPGAVAPAGRTRES